MILRSTPPLGVEKVSYEETFTLALFRECLREMGMYDAETMERLPVYDEDGTRLPEDRILLEPVDLDHRPGPLESR